MKSGGEYEETLGVVGVGGVMKIDGGGGDGGGR